MGGKGVFWEGNGMMVFEN